MVKRLIRPQYLALAIALFVFAGLTILRHAGLLQRWELVAYDIMLRERHRLPASDSRIAIIGITEDDIRRSDYPLRDADLARLLKKILAARPRAVGLDLYRDLPEPRRGAELPELTAVLRDADKVVTIFSPDDAGKPGSGIAAPIALQSLPEDSRPDRITVNDFPTDGEVVRRALIIEDAQEPNHPGGVFSSFAFQIALLDLAVAAPARGLPMPTVDFQPDKGPEVLRLGKAEFRRFHGNDGGYFGAEETGFQFLLDFRESGHFPIYSLSAVMAPGFPASKLEDRVVLIGGVSRSIKDVLATPLEPFLPGVMLHAQAIDQIHRAVLDGDQPTRVIRGWFHPLWTLMWSIVGAASALALLKWPSRAAFALAGGIAAMLAVKYVAFERGWWLAPVEPGLGFVISAIATLAIVFAWERYERGELMLLFSRHVSSKVADSIWQQRETFMDGQRPRAQRLTATVLFTDFAGFSSVSEKADPAMLMDWLNEGMERLAANVEAHGGIVNKYIGDAIMAIFGAPAPSSSEAEITRDAVNAVRCALGMSRDLDILNRSWGEQNKPHIEMRVGIYTGELVAGSMGSSSRLEFTVIGDTVNTASRLESTMKDEIPAPPGRSCRILVGEATYARLGGKFSAELVGAIQLKGKENRINAYRILDEVSLTKEQEFTVPATL